MSLKSLPIVVIGAGPVGLAAVAHLLERGMQPVLLEAGNSVGSGMLRWAHVRMFSPWEYSIDRVAGRLLDHSGWQRPDPAGFPTGADVVEQYLRPLAALPEIAAVLRLGARVQSVSKQRRDRMKGAQRNEVPFLVRYSDADGEHEILAQGVIDASGTIDTPSPAGASGIPALGERALRAQIHYGIPDVLGAQRERYAGKRVLVLGSGHSAFNVLNDLARLAHREPATQIQWAIRRNTVDRVLGGGELDQLRQRGELGLTIGRLLQQGLLQLATGFQLERLVQTAQGIVAHSEQQALAAVDEIVVTTGFRPDTSLLSELRLALDQGTEAPLALAPLIDPNLHSCGSVRPHGAQELQHPDAGVYIVGMKSYGRAPTFLLLTGYEQVRSVVAALAGDWEAARRVELELPETGVCITHFADEDASVPSVGGCCSATAKGRPGAAERTTAEAPTAIQPKRPSVASSLLPDGCCGGPAQLGSDACCQQDALAKARGDAGCGCALQSAVPAAKPAAAAIHACCA